MIRNKAFYLVFLIIPFILSMCSTRQNQFPFVIPWDDASESITNLSFLNHKPAGKYGFVFVNEDGHTATENGRMRFWGVNLGFGACFPEHHEAGCIAEHMAKYGINLVRFHHMDMYKSPGGIWKSVEPDREIDKTQLDKLDYFIYQLKENGIYSDLNLLVSRPFHPGNELHESIDGIFSEFSERVTFNARKTLLFFSDDINMLKNTFNKQILTHYNPYTKSTYADEPAIAFIEPLNECGILHSYFSGYITNLPDYYKNRLEEKWNEWIFSKYRSINEILKKWDTKSFQVGKNHLEVKHFNEETLGYWTAMNDFELLQFKLEEHMGPNYYNALKITKKEAHNSIILLQNQVQGLKPGIPYRLFFYIKTESMVKIVVRIKKITREKEEVVSNRIINISDFWIPIKSEVLIFSEEVDIQFSIIDISKNTHGIWFSNIEFEEALPLKDQEKVLFDGLQIKLFNPGNSNIITMNGNRDWFSFLMDLEEKYWIRELDFLKNSLGVKCPVISTMASVTAPSLLKELDITSDTQYWGHPQFHGTREWDLNDWYVENYPMVNFPQTSKVGELAIKRVAGQPFIVAEYNHPHPNTFGVEAFFFVSAYALLQDWDGVIAFSYCQNEKDWGSEHIRNFFDIDQNPVKLASFVPCALQFLRGDLQPARNTIQVPISRKKELEIIGIKSRMWKVLDAEYAGLNPLMSLLHKVEIIPCALETEDFSKKLVPDNKNFLISDTGEITWDNSRPERGVLRIQSERSISLTGFLDGEYNLSGIRIISGKTLQQGFCAIALSVIKGTSFSDAERIVITALGTVDNTDAVWYTYPDKKQKFPPDMYSQITLRNKWGKFPTYVEGIPADIIFPYNNENITVWALDARGKRKKEIRVKKGNNTATIRIHPRFKTIWYELEREQ